MKEPKLKEYSMKIFLQLIMLISSLNCFYFAQSKTPELTEYKSNYLGQPAPGNKAVPFAAGFFNKNIYSSVVFSNDGKEAYWSTQSCIYQSKQLNGTWTKPEPLNLISGKPTCPMLLPDNKRLYFNDWNNGTIYYAERTDAGWSKPTPLPEVINSTSNIHWNISVDNKRNLYLAFGESNTDVKILYSEFKNGEYTKPALIESLKDETTICPYVAPDGSYLIYVKFTVTEKSNDRAFYIMFKNKSERWGKEINISEIIGENGFCSYVTNDGKYLFFFNKDTMYWVDASFIEELRKEMLKGN